MSERFAQLKRRFVLTAVLKSIVVGVCCGLVATGTVLLALKLNATTIANLYYALIAVCTTVIVTGIAFAIFAPTDKRVAKKLDVEYGLKERVRTALAYQGNDGDVYQLQREDTAATLNALKLHKPTFKQIWVYALAALLAVAMITVALLVPAKVITAPPVDPPEPPEPSWEELPFNVSEAQLERLGEVVQHVNGYALDEQLKEKIVGELTTLLDLLPTATTNGDMLNLAVNTVRKVDDNCKAAVSYYKLGNSLNNMGRADVAKIFAAGAETYKKYTLQDNSAVISFYNNRASIADEYMEESLSEFLTTIIAAHTTAQADADAIYSSINLAIIMANVSADNALFMTLNNFKNELHNYKAVPGDGGEELTAEQAALVAKIDTLYTNFSYRIADELADQAFVFAVDTYVKNVLLEILALTDRPDANVAIGYDLTAASGGNSGGKDDDESKGGGYGEGDTIYGSADLIYDPDTGEYVPYGQLINKYYAIVNALLNEGKLTEEQASIIRAYFETLLSGVKDKQ